MLFLRNTKEGWQRRNSFHLKRLTVSVTVFLFSGFMYAFAQENAICIVETREYPGRDPVMWDGLYAASDGKFIRL